MRLTHIDSAYRAGQDILKQYGTQAIVTLGKDGALAILKTCDLSHSLH